MKDLNSFHLYLHSTGIEPWALDSHAINGLCPNPVLLCFAGLGLHAGCMHPQNSTVPLQK